MAIRKRQWTSGGATREAWVYDFRDQHGQRHIKTFRTKKAAEDERTRTEPKVKNRTFLAESDSGTVKDAVDSWIEACRRGRDGRDPVEPHTLRSYEGHADHIKERIGDMRLSRLTTQDVEAFRDKMLDDGFSRPQTRKVLSSLKAALRNARLPMDIAGPVKLVIADRHKESIELPSLKEAKKMFAELDKLASQSNKGQAKAWRRWRVIIKTAMQTGMRASEVRGLTWADVNLDAGTIRVAQRADEKGIIGPVKTKAGRRTINLPSGLVMALKAWKLETKFSQPEDLVFCNWSGKPELLRNIHARGWKPLLAKCKLPSYRFHAARHFHASRLIADSATAKQVQSELGHTSIVVTYDLYGHMLDEDGAVRKDRAERLGAELG